MSDVIKVGIVGIGRAGWGMQCKELDGLTDRFKIVAGCDPIESRRTKFVEKYTDARAYERIDGLLADDNVDLVSIATPSTLHAQHALRALDAGKHVLLEKPMAVTYEDAASVVEAAQSAKGQLFVRHNRRFEAAFVQIRQIIDSGILGDIHSVKLHRHNYQRRDDWQTIIEQGGGQLLNWGPHIVEHCLRFLGEPPVSVSYDLKLLAAVGDAEDHVRITFTGRDALTVEMEISGGSALKQPVYVVQGTRGALISENEKTIKLRYLDPKQQLEDREANPGTPGEGFGSPEKLEWVEEEREVTGGDIGQQMWKAVHAALVDGQTYPISHDQALDVMRVLHEVRTSATIRKPAPVGAPVSA